MFLTKNTLKEIFYKLIVNGLIGLILLVWKAIIPFFANLYKTKDIKQSLILLANLYVDNIPYAFGISVFFVFGYLAVKYFVQFKAAKRAGLEKYYSGKDDISNILAEKIRKSNSVDIIVITGEDTLGEKEDTPIKKALTEFKGLVPIRILLMEPECIEMEQRAISLKSSFSHYKEQIQKTTKFIEDLKKNGIPILYKFYKQKPIWKTFIFENELYLQSYPPRIHSDSTPMFCFLRRDNNSLTLYYSIANVFIKKWDEN